MDRLTFAVSDHRVEGRTLTGTAHVYGAVTQDGRQQAFAPGAFAKSLASGRIVSFAYHDSTKPLASMPAGSLRLADGPKGLRYAIDLPEGVSYADDLRAYVAAGNDLAMSFQIGRTGRQYRMQQGVQLFTDVNLLSVDPVALAAFEGTSVELNSYQEPESADIQAIRIRARVARNGLRKSKPRS